MKNERHWAWFVVILGLLVVLGAVLSTFAMLPLAMATDGCHGDDHQGVCALSGAGQNVLVLIPWIALGSGSAAAVAGALVVWRRGWSPLVGLPFGVLAYALTVPAVYRMAFHV